jgi:hypothetical protein
VTFKPPSIVTPNSTPSAASQPVAKADDSKPPALDGPPPSVALANAQSSTSGFAAFSTPSKRSAVAALPSSGTTPPSGQRESLAGPVRRSKSPVGKHQAFGQYSAGMSRFGNLSSRKSTQDETPNPQPTIAQSVVGNQTEFEDILKAKGDESVNHHADKLDIHEIEREFCSIAPIDLSWTLSIQIIRAKRKISPSFRRGPSYTPKTRRLLTRSEVLGCSRSMCVAAMEKGQGLVSGSE